MKIRITADNVSIGAELKDSTIGQSIWNALPIQQNGFTWGDEIYFSIPVRAESEDAREVVESGDLAYWPTGSAFCIFFGPTPASHGEEIRPASAVEVVGRLLGEPADFRQVKNGAVVTVERIEEE